MSTAHDPQPNQRHQGDPIQDLLETRQAVRDFETECGTVRVATHLLLDGPQWSYRSDVRENGVEIQEGPFAPIGDRLDSDELEPEWVEDSRREFADRAFATHLERCRLVERALLGPRQAARSNRHAAAWLVGACLIALLVLAAVALHRSRRGVDSVSARAAGATQEAPAPSGSPQLASAPSADPGPVGVPGAVAPAPAFPPPRDEPSGGKLPPRRPEAPGVTPPPSLRASSPPDRPAAAQDRPAPDTPAKSSVDLAAPAVATPGASGPLIRDLEPSHYGLGTLRPGEAAYVDHPAKLTDVPRGHLGCPTIRTSHADGDRKAGVSFVLAEPARIFVGHDRRLRKKPEWLQSFTATGETWQVAPEGDAGDATILDVFSRAYPPGPVELGANTGRASALRRFRGAAPRAGAMYLVCVAPAD